MRPAVNGSQKLIGVARHYADDNSQLEIFGHYYPLLLVAAQRLSSPSDVQHASVSLHQCPHGICARDYNPAIRQRDLTGRQRLRFVVGRCRLRIDPDLCQPWNFFSVVGMLVELVSDFS